MQIRLKGRLFSDGLFYLGIEFLGVKGGSFVKIGVFFPNLYEYPP